jgi:hypothetical protein
MKKYGMLLLPFLATGWSCSQQQPWLTRVVDERVVVQVPAELQELAPENLGMPPTARQIMWGAEDAEGMYLVLRQTPGHINNRERYYEGLVKGVLRSAHGELLARSTFPTRGGNGIELMFKARDPNSGKSVVQYSRSVLVDSCTYSFSFVSRNEQDSTGASGMDSRRRFFESITVTPRMESVVE